MKNPIFIILLCIGVKHSFSQMLVDPSYCEFDSANNYYKLITPVPYSELNNTSIFHYGGENAATISEQWQYIDQTGTVHHKFIQTKNGVPILNSDFAIRTKNEFITDATGLINQNVPEQAEGLTPDNAINSLTGHLNCFKYKWQDADYENNLKETEDNPDTTFYPRTQLKIYKLDNSNYTSTDNFVYIYPIVISALYTESDSVYIDSVYYVNSVNGDIIKRFSSSTSCFGDSKKAEIKNPNTQFELCPICSQACVASPNTVLHYYGSQTIYTEKFLHTINCTHRLKDICTNTYLYVVKGQSGTGTDFRNNSNNWSGAGNVSDQVGATGMWCLEMSHDFFRNTLGRNSYDNSFGQMKIYIHPGNKTLWTQTHNYMTIGTGGTSSYQVMLDIIGHEVTHGVTDQICFLTQDATVAQVDEEFAIGEGYGDIFGQAVEHYVNANVGANGALDDFLFGGNIPGGLTWKLQRAASNPNSNGHPDTYLGNFWEFGGDDPHHRNSTILSHWYFLLCQGGMGINDNNDPFCVTGIGQNKAIHIAYLSLFYLNGTAKQYADARNATIQAATALHGIGSNEVAQVTAAWRAVGVGLNYAGSIDVTNHTATGAESYQYNCQINMANFTGQSGSNVLVTSNTEIDIQPNIAFHSGALFSAFITPACAGGARGTNSSIYTHTENTQETSIPPLSSMKESSSKEKTSFDYKIIPNPNNGVFKLSLDNRSEYPTTITIANVLGNNVETIEDPKAFEFDFDLRFSAPGIYIVQVTYSGKTISKRIAKN